MGRRSALLLAAGVLLVVVSVLLPGRPPPCFVRDGGACLDARLTGRADGYVSSIDSETPGVPLWYITFEAAGAQVQAKVADWPPAPGGPANGPRVGSTVHVAYDPAAPADHATDADALAALQADVAAGREGGKASFLAIGVRSLGVALMVLSGLVFRDERRRAARPAPAGPGPDGGAAPEPPQ